MHLFSSRTLSLLSTTSLMARNFTSTLSPENAFSLPGAGDVRAPCPALNTLANHGFIARSGKGIAATDLIKALQSMYYLSLPLATTLVSAGIACCGSVFTGLDLDALAAHNKIEHDASLVHDNAAPGATFAPIPVNQTLLTQLLEAHPNGLALDDFARARFIREQSSAPLDPVHEEIGHGEASMTWLLMQDSNGVVPVERLKQWYGEERFPDSYSIPKDEISLLHVTQTSAKVTAAMNSYKN